MAGSILAISLVSACSESSDIPFLQTKNKSGEVSRSASTTTKLVERDVEAPDVFSATEAGLWDGRPSLGGVWVAHPDVTEPERVIIRNTANGKFVIGALFRRERDIPGPRLQASSDAAGALGMLAGAPVQLNITALRREEAAPAVSAAPEAAEDAPVIAETALEPIVGGAEAAIAASEAPTDADTATIDTADSGSGDEAKPARKPWFGAKLFARKGDKDVGEPLNALAPQPVVAAVPEVVSAPIPEPAAKPSPRASSLTKPFIQIGIFSVESNASNAADQMRSAGMVPTVFEQSTNGKPFWRVVVGPTQSSSERSALLKQIQGVGYSDAYAVTN